jgi:hypothetical protein
MIITMIERPSDDKLWLAAFQAKFEGKGTWDKSDWDNLLGDYMVVCLSFRHKDSCRLTDYRRNRLSMLHLG